MHSSIHTFVLAALFVFSTSVVHGQKAKDVTIDLTKTMATQVAKPIANCTKSELAHVTLKLTGIAAGDDKTMFAITGNFTDNLGLLDASKTLIGTSEVHFPLANLANCDLDSGETIYKYTITYTGAKTYAIFEGGNTFDYTLTVSPDAVVDSSLKDSLDELDSISIPIPYFTSYEASTLAHDKRNRTLVIDCDPNAENNLGNVLYRRKSKKLGSHHKGTKSIPVRKSESDLKRTKSIPVGASVKVFLKNYGFDKIDNISVTMSGKDFKYESDLSSLIKGASADSVSADDIAGLNAKGLVRDDSLRGASDPLLDYLNRARAALNPGGERLSLNLTEAQQVQAYQKKLNEAVKKPTPAQSAVLQEVLAWSPKYIILTDIGEVPTEADEVDISVSIKKTGEDEAVESKTGSYFTSGRLGVSVNSMVFVTGLKSNPVYTQDSVVVSGTDTTTSLYAHINDGKDQFSVGIGLAAEVSLRTGSIFRPTLTAGFFIPFDEEISPYFAVGSGVSIGTGKVKFSLTAGLALGSVNTIADKYKGQDLSSYSDLTNEKLTANVWQASWQAGIGVSYNIK